MPNPTVEKFIAALKQSEDARDPGPVAALFADDAELHTLAHPEPKRGRDGARAFWDEYLKAFGRVRSEFGAVIDRDGSAALEWASEGALPNGKPIRYRGVSVLEVDGDRVTRFRTYYDTAAFVTVPEAAARPANTATES